MLRMTLQYNIFVLKILLWDICTQRKDVLL